MTLIDTVEVDRSSGKARVELYEGDVLRLPEKSDLLIVATGPYDYLPLPATLLEALYKDGVNVAALSRLVAVDRRSDGDYWLSQELKSQYYPSATFRRLLVFEPKDYGSIAEMTRKLFEATASACLERRSIRTIAMPVIFTGPGGLPTDSVLISLVETAVHWLALGLPIDVVRITVGLNSLATLRGMVDRLRSRLRERPSVSSLDPEFDLFISYSSVDRESANLLATTATAFDPNLRVFIDTQTIRAGSLWQHRIFTSLDASKRVIALLSPSYVASDYCVQEFNIALFRGRAEGREVLVPIYFRSANLPTYMTMVQWHDCREGDDGKLKSTLRAVLAE